MAKDDVERGFRFEPIRTHEGRVLLRPRLTTLLTGRFDKRVTTIIGAAGAGKSTALALAIENKRLGVDIRANDPDIEGRVNDAVRALAPLDVAIHLDDAHLITSPESLEAIASLIRDLLAGLDPDRVMHLRRAAQN
jgi:predicted ABC-type transport system involved in lysophospholipase L1 biosynthesis ATPase subunit